MSNHVLIADADSILKSKSIQIIHKHPDFSHKKRTDLDPWEFVATSYPIALANKIIPFLDVAGSPIAATRARTRSPKRQKSASPVRRTRSTAVGPDTLKTDNKRARSPRKRSPAKSSIVDDQVAEVATPQKITLTDLPMPHFTPARSHIPFSTATPGTTDTIFTSRTVSPGGTLFSPLKPFSANGMESPHQPTAKDPVTITTIPSCLFSPAKQPPTLTSQLPLPPLNVPTPSEISRQPPRSLPFTYNATYTILAHQVSLPTLTLRHNLSTAAIRDVFHWCLASVSAGHIIDLQGWLIHFRDTSRVREIMEVCLDFGLVNMAGKAAMLLEELEAGFGRRQLSDVIDEDEEGDEESQVVSNRDGDQEEDGKGLKVSEYND